MYLQYASIIRWIGTANLARLDIVQRFLLSFTKSLFAVRDATTVGIQKMTFFANIVMILKDFVLFIFFIY